RAATGSSRRGSRRSTSMASSTARPAMTSICGACSRPSSTRSSSTATPSASPSGWSPMPETDKTLLRRYRIHGHLQARDTLIERPMPLVRSLARRYAYRGEPLDDLVQIGAIGLIKAVDRFDIDRGVELTTYATPNVIGEIKRHFRDRGWAVRVPRGLQELNMRLSRLIEQLTVELGR